MSIYLLSILHRSLTDEERSTSIEDSTEDPLLEAIKKEYGKYQTDRKQIKIDKKKLEDEKKMGKRVKMTDVIRLNVGGEIIVTTRNSLTSVSMSVLTKLFNGRWDERMSHDMETNLFLDFNPVLFCHLLEQLRQLPRNTPSHFTPPRSSSPFAVQAFNRMLRKLGLDRRQPSSNEMVVLNVGGDEILTRQRTLNSSRSTALSLLPSKEGTGSDAMKNGLFVDADPWLFRHLLGPTA